VKHGRPSVPLFLLAFITDSVEYDLDFGICFLSSSDIHYSLIVLLTDIKARLSVMHS